MLRRLVDMNLPLVPGSLETDRGVDELWRCGFRALANRGEIRQKLRSYNCVARTGVQTKPEERRFTEPGPWPERDPAVVPEAEIPPWQ